MGDAATRDAAVEDLRTALTGVQCALRLLHRHLNRPTERELTVAVEREAERALATLGRVE
jgi:nitrogen-specific signal transduction histidine kinase